ncbi:response regulator transcription factor [Gilvibacter sp.]|uniref:response regulator n=1 Tax=Gilvibacter sp. TaxID=2729997 RepID=UPI0025C6CB63|nr:response regulator transcription factor [Gilvibacter sp.]NQX76196.1 response regulator transcription factor [Gilvibacter sp.]
MSIKIAITDDHQLVLQGIKSMLSDTEEVNVVAGFSTAEQTLQGLASSEAEVLLLDINLPDLDGISLSKKLLQQQPELKIIALTNFEDLSFVKRMLKNGVHGYLLKNTDKLELISALKAVLSGEIYLQKDLQKRLLLNDTKSNSRNQLIPKLTRREQEVLQAIAEELTTKEISEKLFISPKTVETHRMNLMSKLGAKNSVGIIKIALENELL